jgi:hypothetical protein
MHVCNNLLTQLGQIMELDERLYLLEKQMVQVNSADAQTVHKNVMIIKQHAEETRQMAKEVSEDNKKIRRQLLMLQETVDNFNAQLGFLRSKLLGGGGTG